MTRNGEVRSQERELSGCDTERMPRYIVDDARAFDSMLHGAATLGRKGLFSLHGCGEPAVATMTAHTGSGRPVTLAVCERGVDEYELRDRLP